LLVARIYSASLSNRRLNGREQWLITLINHLDSKLHASDLLVWLIFCVHDINTCLFNQDIYVSDGLMSFQLADPNCIDNVLWAKAMDWACQTNTPLKVFQQISSRYSLCARIRIGWSNRD
jgi:hypothetical protein